MRNEIDILALNVRYLGEMLHEKMKSRLWALRDNLFIEEMKLLIHEFLLTNANNSPLYTLELLKVKMREKAIRYSRLKAIEKRNKLAQLRSDFNTYEINLAKTPNCQELQAKLDNTKVQIELIEQERLKSAQIRSKVKYITEGDKSTKFFLGLEKSNANSKLLPNIELDDGTLITNQHDIRNAQRDFYKTLYSVEDGNRSLDNDLNNFLKDSNVPTLTNDEMKSCEGKISIEEATHALKNMNNGSSPGPDGLSTEFYQIFWKELRDIVVRSYNESFNTGSLSFTQTSAVLTLIHKGKELQRNKLKNPETNFINQHRLQIISEVSS